jgi:hypothetical protein
LEKQLFSIALDIDKKKRKHSLHLHSFSIRSIKICELFIGLAYQGNEIAIRFIIEYSSSLRDFGPSEVNRSILYEDFLKYDILACVET